MRAINLFNLREILWKISLNISFYFRQIKLENQKIEGAPESLQIRPREPSFECSSAIMEEAFFTLFPWK